MNIYDFTVKSKKQLDDIPLSQYRGMVLLIVNTATHCGLTPQYEALENLYKKFKDRGFEILDFPCNQFLGQAPGSDDEISSFCTLNYGTTFPRFAKVDVNGENASPLFTWLKEQGPADTEDDTLINFTKKLEELGHKVEGKDIKWNFTKFLINSDGKVAARFAPTVEPLAIENEIEKLLAELPDDLTCSAEFTEGCQ